MESSAGSSKGATNADTSPVAASICDWLKPASSIGISTCSCQKLASASAIRLRFSPQTRRWLSAASALTPEATVTFSSSIASNSSFRTRSSGVGRAYPLDSLTAASNAWLRPVSWLTSANVASLRPPNRSQ